MNYAACPSCGRIENVSNYVSELMHQHGKEFYMLTIAMTLGEAEEIQEKVQARLAWRNE